jgi:hypothetical protein
MNTIDLCNAALAMVGVDRGIESLEDDEPAARYCSRLYPQIRASLLRDHPWRWALRRAALATLTDTLTGWEYVYAYPSDCAKLLNVEDSDPDKAIQYPFEIRALAGGTVAIACDVYQAYARYSRDVVDANLFDASFAEALSAKLAARLAISLTGDRQLAGGLMQEADQLLVRAKVLDAGEGFAAANVGSSFIEARTA